MTGQYLSGRREIPVPEVRRPSDQGQRGLNGHGAREHNLRRRRRVLPLGLFVAVTGVSGPASPRWSTTSSTPRWPTDLQRRAVPGRHQKITGLERRQGHPRRPVTDRAHAAVQPATYTGSSTTSASSSPRPRGQDARLPRAGSPSTSRVGAARRVRRRHDQDRDELPAGRLRPVRGLSRCRYNRETLEVHPRARRSPRSSTCRSRRRPTSSPPCPRSRPP